MRGFPPARRPLFGPDVSSRLREGSDEQDPDSVSGRRRAGAEGLVRHRARGHGRVAGDGRKDDLGEADERLADGDTADGIAVERAKTGPRDRRRAHLLKLPKNHRTKGGRRKGHIMRFAVYQPRVYVQAASHGGDHAVKVDVLA